METIARKAHGHGNLLRAGELSHRRAVVVIVAVSTVLLGIFLGSGDPSVMMELFNLVPVREAFRDGHWFMPTLNGAPRFEKPPLAAWIPAALAWLVGSDNLWIVRVPSLVLGVLTCLATYALGCRIFRNPDEPEGRNRWYALLAALLLPTMHLFNHQARLASYDIYAAAFAMGAALCWVCLIDAVAEARASGQRLRPGRWWLWTVLAGVSLGLSCMSKGPAPAATVLLPLAVWMMIFHRSRAAVWAMVMSVVLSLVVAVPWGLAIFEMYPEARLLWTKEIVKLTTARRNLGTVDRSLRDPWYYYVQMLIWVAPLTPTFIAGLALPFLPVRSSPPPSARERQGRWLCWLVVIGGLVLLSLPAEKKLRYTLQLAPFASLLCAAVWQEFMRLDRAAKVEVPAGLVLWGQALFFIVPGVGAVVLALWVGVKGSFLKWPQVAEVMGSFGLVLALLVGVVLLAVGVWHLRQDYRQQFGRAAGTLVLGAIVMMLGIQWILRSTPAATTNPTRGPVEAAVALAGNARIFTVPEARPWIHTIYFANRPMKQESQEAILKDGSPDTFAVMLVVENSGGDVGREHVAVQAATNAVDYLTAHVGPPRQLAEWWDEKRHTVLLEFSGVALQRR